jgi:hypothetical protein
MEFLLTCIGNRLTCSNVALTGEGNATREVAPVVGEEDFRNQLVIREEVSRKYESNEAEEEEEEEEEAAYVKSTRKIGFEEFVEGSC